MLLRGLLFVAIVALVNADEKITNTVFFDVEIDGVPSGRIEMGNTCILLSSFFFYKRMRTQFRLCCFNFRRRPQSIASPPNLLV